jgi:hypothetical protein
MNKVILCLTLFLGFGFAALAQEAQKGSQEVRFGVGVRGPVDRSLGWEASEVVSLSYAHYGPRNFGYRAGVEFMPQIMDIDTYIGVPVAFSARTRSRTFGESLTNGLESAAVGAVRDAVYGYEPNARSVLGDFLLGLFNRAEFFVGVTPGIIAGTNIPHGLSYGESTVTDFSLQLNNRFSLTADAGFSMSFRIWQFNLGFVPAVHYYLTRNFTDVRQTRPVADDMGSGSTVKETPVRFHFSVLGALSFSF